MFRSTYLATKAAAVRLAVATVWLFVAVPAGARTAEPTAREEPEATAMLPSLTCRLAHSG